MNYHDFIERALQGRSVYKLAKALDLNQVTLNRYIKGDRLPDYATALLLAHEAKISPGDAMLILAEEERHRKHLKETFAAGFRYLTSTLNRLFTRVPAV